ncbi:unnamed protein product [Arabidopsis arenosa]|uniref:Uncharacterized protein n=1 Tax=Arabidopsis arenosa TaxID=38785 RepID=A0A8S2AZ38_ARAAE|nr:unnamed protein product [Arabidopsis arenosa]
MTYAPRKILAIQDNGDSPPRSILFEQENNGKPKMTLKDADLTYGDDSLVDLDVIGHCDPAPRQDFSCLESVAVTSKKGSQRNDVALLGTRKNKDEWKV